MDSALEGEGDIFSTDNS